MEWKNTKKKQGRELDNDCLLLRAMTSSWSSTMRALKEDMRESRQVPASFNSILSISLSLVPSFPPLCSFLSLLLQIDRNCDSSSLSSIFNFTFKCHGREWGMETGDFISRSHMIYQRRRLTWPTGVGAPLPSGFALALSRGPLGWNWEPGSPRKQSKYKD